MVNFPFKNFDPTAYLASVPQETILRHRQLLEKNKSDLDSSYEANTHSTDVTDRIVEENGDTNGIETKDAQEKLLEVDGDHPKMNQRIRPSGRRRERLESTSLIKTPIVDEDLRDFHEHKLQKGQDPFDLKYQLYAVVVSPCQLKSVVLYLVQPVSK